MTPRIESDLAVLDPGVLIDERQQAYPPGPPRA
jgi:hypothetical protein